MVAPPQAQSERRLVWHPRQTNRFVVGGGSQIVLYEWSTSHPGIRHVTSRQDSHMRCFQFSPDDRFDDLLAVGHNDGRVDLLRLEASKYAGQNNVLSSGPIHSLKSKGSRPCNALAFSSANPNYLAVGLDKVRGDNSLMIWDIHSALPLLSEDRFSMPDPHTSRTPIPRTETGPRTDSRILQQHAPTEMISALAFLPNSTNILLAGISNRWLRMFDLRKPTPGTTNAAFKVQSIVTDPFDAHRFGCFGGDGLIAIWDSRKLPHPILTFSEKDALADGALVSQAVLYSTIEFSSVRRGILASLERDGKCVRFWDIQECSAHPIETPTREPQRDSVTSSTNAPARLSWATLPWASSALNHPPQLSPAVVSPFASHVLTNTRHTKVSTHSLASFAIVPDQNARSLVSQVMVTTKDGDVEVLDVYDTPKQAVWSARGDVTIGGGLDCRVIRIKDLSAERWETSRSSAPNPHSTSKDVNTELKSLRGDFTPPLFGRGDEDGFPALFHPSILVTQRNGGTDELATSKSHKMANRVRQKLHHSRSLKGVEHIIHDDVSMIMKRRAMRGYGIGDPVHNLHLLEEEDHPPDSWTPLLIELWRWLNHSRDFLMHPTSRLQGFEFAYEGLLGVWEGFRSQVDIMNRSAVDIHNDFNSALEILVSRYPRSAWKPMVHTNKALRRQVCLHLCGWSFTDEQLANDVKNWEEQGKISQAACWLVFTRQFGKAIELLLRSEDESHHMMAGTLAALTAQYGSSVSRNPELEKHCERLIVKLQDPYFRALLTHLTHGDWSDVLSEEIFPLRERLAIAFQFLDDKSLGSYLRRCNGDIDSLIVTGLTMSGMKILSEYVDRTADVQTAAILSSYVQYWKIGNDSRAEQWIETYRSLLDSYKLHHFRVSFDIDYGHLLQTAIGSAVLPPFDWVPRQILIRCNYCSKAISGTGSTAMGGEKATACPHCKRGLPRCSICLMTLSLVQDSVHEGEMATHLIDTTRDAIIICQTCRHGGHASHILEWFFNEDGTRSHDVCAVADCTCQCADKL